MNKDYNEYDVEVLQIIDDNIIEVIDLSYTKRDTLLTTQYFIWTHQKMRQK